MNTAKPAQTSAQNSSLAATATATAAANASAAANTAGAKKPYQTPRSIKFIDSVLDTIIVAIIVFILAFFGFVSWDTNQMHAAAMSDQYERYNPAIDPLSFEELRAINPDVFGWLTVYGTLIDFPLLQGETNSHYLNHGPTGEFSLAGSIFLDVANDRNFTDFNHIIHGHHMEQGAKFGNIDLFTELEFFESRRYGNLFFNGKDHGLEFFAFLETSGYNWQVFNPAIEGRENQEAYIAMLMTESLHTRDIGVTADDRIVLLATCTSDFTNGRHLLIGKIHDEPFPNPFGEEEEAARERQNFIDGELLPMLRTICLPALLLAIILVLIYCAIQKRRRWDVEDKWTLIESNPALLKKLEEQGLGLNKDSLKKDDPKKTESKKNGANGNSNGTAPAKNGNGQAPSTAPKPPTPPAGQTPPAATASPKPPEPPKPK